MDKCFYYLTQLYINSNVTVLMLKINQLHKSFNNIEVLKGIDAEFNSGETSLIIGQSGSGKTVLLKCLLDLYS